MFLYEYIEKKVSSPKTGLDYFTFGKTLRSFNGGNKYGHQSSERESELSENDYYTHFRGLDDDIARWKQIDPVFTPHESPYVSMGNNPVALTDVLGNTVEDWFKNLRTGEIVENKNINGKKGEQVSLAGSSDTWENVGKTAMEANAKKPAEVSSTDIMLATAGTVAKGGEVASDIIMASRSGYSSGKLFPNSASNYNKFNATKLNLGAKLVGSALNLLSMRNTEVQYRNGEIGDARRTFNHLNNTVGLRFPILGIPIAVGDYYGQKYEQQINDSWMKPEGILYKSTIIFLNTFGVKTGEEKK